VFVKTAEGFEDCLMQVFESLIPTDLDRAGHDRILLGEPFGDLTADEKDLQRIDSHLLPVSRLIKPEP
jgi:hypothetical protein